MSRDQLFSHSGAVIVVVEQTDRLLEKVVRHMNRTARHIQDYFQTVVFILMDLHITQNISSGVTAAYLSLNIFTAYSRLITDLISSYVHSSGCRLYSLSCRHSGKMSGIHRSRPS